VSPRRRRRVSSFGPWGLSLLCGAALGGCALPNARDDLEREVALHHIDLRWGRLENAAQRVAAEMRGPFVQSWAARLADVELQDIEVAALSLSADGNAADVVVSITFVDRTTMQVRSARLAEHWQRERDGTWRATTPATPQASGPSATTPPPEDVSAR
jgi:hypothetical protein